MNPPSSSRKTNRPTIRDVAAAAGVSRGTVSRVLNGGGLVSPRAKQAVERAIRDTGYKANHYARSLATGRSGSLAFVLTEPQHLLFDDPTFARLLRGIAEALSLRHMTLVLLVAGSSDERDNVLHYIGAGHVDGVMLVSTHEQDSLMATLVKTGIPMVSAGLPLGYEQDIPSVSIDEEESARRMVRYLRGKGYRRIAMIAGPADTPGGKYRLAGFRDEMAEEYVPELVYEGDYSFGSGESGMEALLKMSASLESPIDAVFAASDSMAAGAISALHGERLAVPGDIAVAGFDDAGLAATHSPPLTTMRQPWDEISVSMVDVLVSTIEGQVVQPVVKMAELVPRQSA